MNDSNLAVVFVLYPAVMGLARATQMPYKTKTEAVCTTSVFFVRGVGLEPTRLSTPDPKSDAATNYAISANL